MRNIASRKVLVGVILASCLFCQASKDPLSADLEALHSKWFAAFDAGDWAAMDAMEMPNLILILPNGDLIQKQTQPRRGKPPKQRVARSLESVLMRQFGDAAILTGVLITKKNTGEAREPTTVVFVKNAGVWKIASAHWSALIRSNGSSAPAAADPFLGKWRMNPAKGHITGQVYKIFPEGDNTYRFDNGSGSTTLLPADGSPQPYPSGGTVSLKRINHQTFLFVLKKSTNYRRTMTVQGGTMKWDEDQKLENGHHNKFQSEWRRNGIAQGIAGEWHRELVHYSQLDETYLIMDIDPFAGDGLSIGPKDPIEVKFDGQEYPQKGESVRPGTTVSGRRPNLHIIELTEKHDSVVTQTQVCELSEDGSTLVVTVHVPKQSESQVFMFDRQVTH